MIGILNRLKYVLPLEIKKLLYNSLILSHINYCIMAWGYKGNRLIKIQKRAVRIITLSGYNSHTEPLFKQLNLLKIEDQLKLQELKFYFKYIHRHLPVNLLNWQITPNVNMTLGSLKIYILLELNVNLQKKILKYNLPFIINNTSDIVKEKIYTHSLRGFTIYAKNFLLQTYKDTCTLPNCYSCHQNQQC